MHSLYHRGSVPKAKWNGAYVTIRPLREGRGDREKSHGLVKKDEAVAGEWATV